MEVDYYKFYKFYIRVAFKALQNYGFNKSRDAFSYCPYRKNIFTKD